MSGDTPIRRRDLLTGGLAAAGFAWARFPLPAWAIPALEDGEEVVPFVDGPQPGPPNRGLHWPDLDSWITPNEKFFAVSHYGVAKVSAKDYRLEISGLVERPRSLSLDEIKSLPKVTETVTLECSGNGVSKTFMGAAGNAKWTGTPLAPILKQCGLKPEGVEVVFWGADQGKEKIRESAYEQNFARSLSVQDAVWPTHLLCYEMNGEPLPAAHGYPVRLISPGWYGIASVKWLSRIEVLDRRLMNRFMGRDYVTIRGVQRGGKTVWMETSVGRQNLKSIIARVTRRGGPQDRELLRVFGAAWTDGTEVKSVEVQIDGGAWHPAKLDTEHRAKYAWAFFTYDFENVAKGRHTLVSRVSDVKGNSQPAPDDPWITMKKTYWESNAQYPRQIELP